MQWVEEIDRGAVHYRAHVLRGLGSELDRAFDELRQKLKDDVLPRHRRDEWDGIRLEFWGDTGRLIAIPELRQEGRLSDKARCELRIDPLFDLWETLVDSEIADDEFGERIREEHLRYANGLLRVWRNAVSHGGEPFIPIRFFEAEEEAPLLEGAVPESALE